MKEAVNDVLMLCKAWTNRVFELNTSWLVSVCSGEERFPEALQLVKEQKLYSEALRLYAADSPHYKVQTHGSHSSARGYILSRAIIWLLEQIKTNIILTKVFFSFLFAKHFSFQITFFFKCYPKYGSKQSFKMI